MQKQSPAPEDTPDRLHPVADSPEPASMGACLEQPTLGGHREGQAGVMGGSESPRRAHVDGQQELGTVWGKACERRLRLE